MSLRWPKLATILLWLNLFSVGFICGTASSMALIEQVLDPPWQAARGTTSHNSSALSTPTSNSDKVLELKTNVQNRNSSPSSTPTPDRSIDSMPHSLSDSGFHNNVYLSSNEPSFNLASFSNMSSTTMPALALVDSSHLPNVSISHSVSENYNAALSQSTDQDFSHISQTAHQQEVLCASVPKCELLQYSECLGTPLPYSHTSLASTRLHSQRAAHAELQAWSRSLRQVPRCWGVVQPYLCSVFFPPCDNATKTLYVPPEDICEAVRGPCALVEEGRGWPSYMRCLGAAGANRTNAQLELRSCSASSSIASSLREVKFNSSSGVCVPPLVPTPRPEAWYEGIRGCALPCHHPHFSREEAAGFHSFLALMGGLCVACCTFTVVTYLLEWRCGGSRRYPSVLLLYVCGCCLVAGVALLVQFHATVRQQVTCHADGTLRTHEPSTESNMSCVVVFVCLYYFGVAAAIWLLILSYSWHCFFTQLVCGERGAGSGGGGSGGGEKGSAYYHLVAWSLPLVLTITTLAMGQVSADNLHGVCFLSPSLGVRLPLLLVPLVLVLLATAVFISKGILRLCQLKMECHNILTANDNTKIVESIVRLAVLLLTLVACGAFTLYSHWHYYAHYSRWQLALRQYILCQAGLSSYLGARSECSVGSRPSLSVYKLQVIAWTCTPLIISSFCWTSSTAHIWRLFIARVIGVPSNVGVVPKHRLVGEEAGVRIPFDACGRLSGSLRGQQIPGVKLALNGPGTGPLGGDMPQLMPPLYTSGHMSHHHSAAPLASEPLQHTDSEQSISTRYSIESGFQYYSSSRQQNKRRLRRHSLDSQLSFHVSDIERDAARHTMVRFAAAAGGQQRASVHSYSSRTSRVSQGGRNGWLGRRLSRAREARRCSYTSEDSSFSSVLVTGVGLGAEDTTLFSNMMRRLHLSSSAASSPIPSASAAVGDKNVCVTAPLHDRATVGVQTSLEEGDLRYSDHLSAPPRVARAHKATQVSPSLEPHQPHFVAYHRPPRLFSESASLNSSSDDALNIESPHTASDWKSSLKYVSFNDRLSPNPGQMNDSQHLDGYLQAPAPSGNYLKRPPLDISPRKDHSDVRPKRKKRKHGSRSNGAVGRRGAVAETSFVDSANVLLSGSKEGTRLNGKQRNFKNTENGLQHYSHYPCEGRNSKTKSSEGGRTSAMTGSRGTCLDAETISTVLDMEDFSDP